MLPLSLLAAGACYLVPALSAPVADGSGSSPPTVTVKNGTYSGVYSSEYDQDFFLGMRYAQQAIRFTQAQSLNTTWDGTQEATAYPDSCIGYGGDDIGYAISEDCLFINVIRPSGINDTSNLPVAVWIHGGGLTMGGSSDKRYNLTFIVENSVKLGTPMVAVSFNYRLSAYGFISGSEVQAAGLTNIGFRDQRLALHWVNENIAAFGGSPDLVTIWGESSGAESVSAHVLAYNGRDDGLFRGAAAESGFGGILPRYAGGLNNTAAQQEAFNNLLGNTSCASTAGTPDAITCLRDAPFDVINTALNVTDVSLWPPVYDGDFIADWPTKQLDSGNFVRVPILIGTNFDEGTAFGEARGPNGTGVQTDAEWATAVRALVDSNDTATTDAFVTEASYLYPDIQSVGIPSLQSWPEIVTNETEGIETLGLQYRRVNALFGDYTMQYTRRRANLAWNKFDVPSYSYRFDVTVNGVPDYVAATHFQEVAFVFYNLNGDGYATNPFGGNTTQAYKDLALEMSSAWVNFFVHQDPNGDNNATTLAQTWPVYDPAVGGGVGQNIVFSVDNGTYVEIDDFRAEGINWLISKAYSVFGN